MREQQSLLQLLHMKPFIVVEGTESSLLCLCCLFSSHCFSLFLSLSFMLDFTVSCQLAQFAVAASKSAGFKLSASFQVTLADIFVAKSWSACCSAARGELAIHDVFGDTTILHSANMTELAEAPL